MDRARFVRHRGVQILLIDLSGMRELEEIRRVAEFASERIAAEPGGSVLSLIDLTDVPVAWDWIRVLIQAGIRNRPYVAARAVVGLDPAAFFALSLAERATWRSLRVFNTREEALDWLAGLC